MFAHQCIKEFHRKRFFLFLPTFILFFMGTIHSTINGNGALREELLRDCGNIDFC